MALLRIAIVGLEHYHVTGWVESLEQFPNHLEIVALYDPSPALGERLAPTYHDPHLSPALAPRYHDVAFTSDLDVLIRQYRPDVALVTLPNALAPVAIQRLARAGIHLLIDKPGARTVAEAEAAFAVARAAGVKVAVGLTRRYVRGYQEAREMVTSGQLGRLFAAKAIFVTSSVQVRDPRNPIFQRALSGGGILHWLGIHDLDLLQWLTGDRVVEVQALAGTVNGEAIDVEDIISVGLRFASGAIGTTYHAYALPRPASDGYLALRGSHGSVKIALDGSLTWIGAGSIADPVTSQQTTYTTRQVRGYGASGLMMIDDLLQAIRHDREPLATGDDLVRALKIIEAAYRAAASGTRVRVE